MKRLLQTYTAATARPSKFARKAPALVNRKNVALLHDNAIPHTARVTQETFLELGWSALPHPPFSPDPAPSDYHFLDHCKTL